MTAALIKLQPNQDVTMALEAAAALAGMERARIVAAVGSLVEGVLRRDGDVEIVPGPGLEVAGLSGEVIVGGGSMLHGYICQPNTTVIEGEFVRGRNAIGVTFEVLLEASGVI